jgi:spermidine/putrescine transport system ATP-binding protein
MGHDIHLDQVTMQFGHMNALTDIDVHIRAGEFFSFLGPSGCGKTTLLKLISGFLEPTRGHIWINRKDMKGVGPHRRPTAMIFQNLALFPLMTVAQNIGFGLDVRKVSSKDKARKIAALLNLVDLPQAGKKSVNDLSGGQKQRVAIARALAVEPSVLLLDEPLSALDLKLRKHMRYELRQIQQKTGVTFVYITHDQGEALTMSDRVGVISDRGTLEQVDAPADLYNHPKTEFTASFVGENNRFYVTIGAGENKKSTVRTSFGTLVCSNPMNLAPGTDATVFIRPETIHLVNGSLPPENTIPCRVVLQNFEGPFVTMVLETADQTLIRMRRNNDGTGSIPSLNEPVTVSVHPDNVLVLDMEKRRHAAHH